ncbi:hypothetical protein LTR10_013718 [Elasticomyces elasticus]|uniref:NAD(P)-binding domain-containing protein n=1 Tax=Exophiala sideris TaxID=1016849 RepID=A0ABR0JGU7_9EURO|nr:hypothetical protein LTR10_013718 [Elasticomyces elasticus]KAK5033306.1 hypothetical protein LTS07_003608 [Exophiala sideris]KAK5042196.1 hypothetical protein LTR13_002002 [Exophiala sideris]KAK5063850.1 hypothetical protein LTR69_003616 [Exophiala sideris]KAK5185464.1 hypothetical protein LTR44_002453 [Eurotiomycetes sp. CCFEE 6388]
MAATSTPRVLLLGGHGKVSLLLSPLLLAKHWNITSVVRNKDHEAEILALGKDKPGKIEVLVDSLDDVKEASQAQKVIDQVKPDYVVWSAGKWKPPCRPASLLSNKGIGAGGKGGPSRTKAVDEIAAKAYISASLATPSVSKFMMVSYIASRKGTPPWWSEEDKKAADHANTNILPHYYKAKVEADEHLEALAKKRVDSGDKKFQAINLRPGSLTDAPGTGKVTLGKTAARGSVSREDVAMVGAALLARDDTRGWFDSLEGKDDIEDAIDELLRSGHNGLEGEDLDRIYTRA